MGRPVKIMIPKFRPRYCAECPLLGTRPKEELDEGSKWTHICMADRRIISGRGSKQPNARNRCSVKQYEKLYFDYQGDFLIHRSLLKKYSINETKLVFP